MFACQIQMFVRQTIEVLNFTANTDIILKI